LRNISGGYTHGAAGMQGARKRAGRDLLYGNNVGGGVAGGGESSMYRGALEEELEGTQQVFVFLIF